MKILENVKELNEEEMNVVFGGCVIDEYEEPVQDEDEDDEEDPDEGYRTMNEFYGLKWSI
ncbi:MAG: hypothetical protein IJ237_09450 [Oscillospiraceae bacterium]|nr:hypothetical protein [Oscillospiraceae bacterium]